MTAEQVTTTVSLLFHVDRADIFSTNRTNRIAEARMALAWGLRQQNWSLEQIGDYLRRDHTTIIYSLEKIAQRAAHNPRLAEKLRALERIDAPPADWEARIVMLEARVKELEKRI